MYRILFSIHGYPIYSFGVMVALAVLAGAQVTSRQAFRVGMTREQALEVVVWVVGLGVLLARLVFVIQDVAQHPELYRSHPAEIFDFRAGGMSWHGCIAGLLLGSYLQARRLGLYTLDVLDACAPGSILGLAIGRIGCFLNGCCYGRITAVPWAVTFPLVDASPRHPSQLYEWMGGMLVFFVLLYVLKHRTFRGEPFLAFLFLYSVLRFVVEFFREGAVLLGGLTLAQHVSLMLMMVSALLWLLQRRRIEAVLVPTPVGRGD